MDFTIAISGSEHRLLNPTFRPEPARHQGFRATPSVFCPVSFNGRGPHPKARVPSFRFTRCRKSAVIPNASESSFRNSDYLSKWYNQSYGHRLCTAVGAASRGDET